VIVFCRVPLARRSTFKRHLVNFALISQRNRSSASTAIRNSENVCLHEPGPGAVGLLEDFQAPSVPVTTARLELGNHHESIVSGSTFPDPANVCRTESSSGQSLATCEVYAAPKINAGVVNWIHLSRGRSLSEYQSSAPRTGPAVLACSRRPECSPIDTDAPGAFGRSNLGYGVVHSDARIVSHAGAQRARVPAHNKGKTANVSEQGTARSMVSFRQGCATKLW